MREARGNDVGYYELATSFIDEKLMEAVKSAGDAPVRQVRFVANLFNKDAFAVRYCFLKIIPFWLHALECKFVLISFLFSAYAHADSVVDRWDGHKALPITLAYCINRLRCLSERYIQCRS